MSSNQIIFQCPIDFRLELVRVAFKVMGSFGDAGIHLLWLLGLFIELKMLPLHVSDESLVNRACNSFFLLEGL